MGSFEMVEREGVRMAELFTARLNLSYLHGIATLKLDNIRLTLWLEKKTSKKTILRKVSQSCW